jgi:2-keto-4-pentenoate hydratase
MKRVRSSIVLVLLMVFVSATAWAGVQEMADALAAADAANKPVPVLSKPAPDLDAKTAYAVQKVYVAQRVAKAGIGGFKGGLTTEGGQKRFGVNAPLAGVLYAAGKLEGSPVVDPKDFRGLMLETEIGFVIGQAIAQPVKDVAELQLKVSGVMPAIELPEMAFDDMKALKGVDIIAANVGAAKYIVGQTRPHKGLDLNDIKVALTMDGQPVNQGQGKDALGDQWKAALWLVNAVVEQGYKIEPGQVLITGALGNMIPGKPGKYVADYGAFGKIAFEVK